MKFDLSSVPSTAMIIKAELNLYADLHKSFEETIDPYIMPVLAYWTENDVTWNTTDGSTAWNNPGGDFDYWQLCFFYDPIEYYEINQWHTADITSFVQYWVDGSLPNNGLIISTLWWGSSKSHRFISSEGTEEFRPKLEITYVDDGMLRPPDSFLDPEIIRRSDSHVYQHLDQDMTMTLNDVQEIGGRIFWVSGRIDSKIDSWVDECRSRGMTVVMTISFRSYSADELYEQSKALAAHFKGRVQWYNAHGEVNNKWYSSHDPKYSPEAIVEKVKAIHDGVKSEDPNAKVSLAQLGSGSPERYIEACVEYGLANWTRMWGYGIWQGGPDSPIPDYKRSYMRNWRLIQLARKEGNKVGHPISVQQEGMTRDIQGHIYQAKIIARKTVLNQYIGMLPHEWYKLYNPSGENFQLVSDDFQTKYEGFYTLKYLNQYLNPSKYPPIHMGIITTPANFYKFAFKASDTDVVLALWEARQSGLNSYVPPTNAFDPGTNADVTFLDYGLSPVQIVDPITGEIIDPAPDYSAKGGKVTIRNVEIRDYPRLIILEGGRTPTEPYGKPGESEYLVD